MTRNYWVIAGADLNATEIVDFVARQFGIDYDEIIGNCKVRKYSDPRMICYYILSRKKHLTHKEISNIFNNNHAASHTGSAKVQDRMEVDKKYREKVEEIISKINFNNLKQKP